MVQLIQKEFKTYGKQLKGLKDRGLDINPVIDSKKILQTENYYNVINGYNALFLKSKNPDTYRSGSSLSEIYALYNFDRNLRGIYLRQVLKIENYIKAILAYKFSEKYGHKDREYLRVENFRTPHDTDTLLSINEFLFKLSKLIWTKKYPQPYIEYYRNEHGYVPLWVLVNSMTFGDLSTFFSFMKDSDRSELAKELSKNHTIMHNNLEAYLKMIGAFRNLLAHDERFYEHRKQNQKGKFYTVNFDQYMGFNQLHNSVMTLTICIRLFSTKCDFDEFWQEVLCEIEILNDSLHTISIDTVLNKMNFLHPGYMITSYNDLVNKFK